MTEDSSCELVAALRMFDATTNRAMEAARLVEDVVRFSADNAYLTEQWKQLRHEIAEIVRSLSSKFRVAARDTPGDVGVAISTASEQHRDDLSSLLQANIERLKQSLRGLEEAAKLLATHQQINATAANQFEQLRYRCYTLEKATLLTAAAREKLANARLYWLTDAAMPAEQIANVLRAGVDIVQLRAKQLTDRELLERAKALRAITRETATRFIVNDRPDVARLSEADGVHLGQTELTVSAARKIVGPDALIGVSTHSIEQARQAVLDGANYLGVGPTFAGETKQFAEFPGLPLVRQVASEIGLPWFAIGGINAERLPELLEAGATRIAVSGTLNDDAEKTSRRLRAMLDF